MWDKQIKSRFYDLKYAAMKKQTRRDRLLSEINKVMPWLQPSKRKALSKTTAAWSQSIFGQAPSYALKTEN